MKYPKHQRPDRRSGLHEMPRSFSYGFGGAYSENQKLQKQRNNSWVFVFSWIPDLLLALEEMSSPIRILTAVPICDGHDSAINTINLEFIRHGIEVIYLGYHRSVGDIVRAAIQEDVRAIGISSYNGGHIEFFAAVVDFFGKKGADDIKGFGGGGGTITHNDAVMMRRKGVDEIFFAGTSLEDMVKFVHRRYGKPRTKRLRAKSVDQELAHKLTRIEEGYAAGKKRPTASA